MLESQTGGVKFEKRGDGYHIVLQRPEKGNALSADMVMEVSEAFDRCMADGARMIVFEGEGRHFCTGFDLSTLDSETDASLLLRFVQIETLLQKVHSSSVMTVAIGKGRCFGAGADLFASCDIRLAVKGASFAFPGSAFGVVLGTARLAGRIGRDNARRCLLSGAILADGVAYDQRLVTDLVVEEELPEMLAALATAARRLDPQTVQALHGATDSANYDRELGDLVRSASRPGLRDRIANYRASLKGR